MIPFLTNGRNPVGILTSVTLAAWLSHSLFFFDFARINSRRIVEAPWWGTMFFRDKSLYITLLNRGFHCSTDVGVLWSIDIILFVHRKLFWAKILAASFHEPQAYELSYEPSKYLKKLNIYDVNSKYHSSGLKFFATSQNKRFIICYQIGISRQWYGMLTVPGHGTQN